MSSITDVFGNLLVPFFFFPSQFSIYLSAMAEVVELAFCKCMVGKAVCNCNRSLMVATLSRIPLFSLSLRFSFSCFEYW